MSYPDAYNDKKFRRIFLFFLIAIFFTLTPILILYSVGYRFDLENRQIIETGVISIDIKPKEAEVYLNNTRILKNLPIRLTNRTPGTYNLKISLPGYKTWEKTIDVKSKQTTYIKNITLLRDVSPTIVENGNDYVDVFLPSTDGRFILLSKIKNDIRNIELFDSQTGEFSLIFKLPLESEYQLEWSPFNNYILFIKHKENIANISLLSADKIDSITNYKITVNDKNLLHYQWQKNSPIPTIFTDENGKIYRLTTNNNEQIFSNSSSTMWYIDDLEKLWLLENNTLKIINSENKQTIITLQNISNVEKIIDINNERVILKTDTDTRIVSRNKNKQETIHTSNFQRNPYTNEWLTWSEWELWSIYEHDEPALLNRTSDNIVFIFPLDNVGALLTANNQGINAFNPGYYVSQSLFNGEVSGASVNQKIKKIYFLGKVDNLQGLFELEY